MVVDCSIVHLRRVSPSRALLDIGSHEFTDVTSCSWSLASLMPSSKRSAITSRISESLQRIPSIKVDWSPARNPGSHYNASKVALLIEPRPLSHLAPHILHMIAVVPPDWRFLFIGSNKSVVSLTRSAALKHQHAIGKLDLMVLPRPWEIDSKEKVHRTLTDMRFYNEFLNGVEWILKYESDSILCANSQVSLDAWLGYSWAGAPRYVVPSACPLE